MINRILDLSAMLCFGVAAFFLLAALAASLGCSRYVPPVEVPAQKDAQELRSGERDAAERAAAAEADAAILRGHGRDKEAAAKADEARLLRAIAAEKARLAAAAEVRVASERVEIAAAEAAAARAADLRRVWWISALGIAGAVGAGFLLSRFLPLNVAIGIPGAVLGFCIALSLWATWGAWILAACGVLVLLAAAGVLAHVLRWAIAEWKTSADTAAEPGSAERQALDKASRDRQPALVQWFLDHVFRRSP